MFKVNNKDTKTTFVNFKQISHIAVTLMNVK